MSICIADLFCGIGGVSEAVRHWHAPTNNNGGPAVSHAADSGPNVVTAIDIDQSVTALYAQNHGISPRCCTIESLSNVATDETGPIDIWWMSPPCQPYTVRGFRRGSADPRSQALARLIQLLPRELPTLLGLENVPAFRGSQHHHELKRVLTGCGYVTREYVICPTDWGIPMRRKRFYLLASRDPTSISELTPAPETYALNDFVDETAWNDESLIVDRQFWSRYESAISIVDVDDPNAITSCFTSAYGKSPVRSGSYLRCRARNQIRRFSADEIAALMGFRQGFFSSCDLRQRSRYRLIGNSLPVHVIRELLKSLLPDDCIDPVHWFPAAVVRSVDNLH